MTDQSGVEGALRSRIQNWRAYAYQGLTDFAESELEDALNKSPEVNDASLGIALATGLMTAFAATNPIAGAVLRPFFQRATAELLKAVGQHQVQQKPGASSDRPIKTIKHTLELIVEHTELALYDALPSLVNNVRLEFDYVLRPTTYQPTPFHPIADDELLNRSLIKMFGYDNVVGDGFKTEVKPDAVRQFYESEAKEKLKTYLSEVHPIGEGRWGHKKVVMVKVVGKVSEYEDRTYAQVARRVGSHDRYEFEFLRWIDDDMVAAAESKLEAADEVIEQVSAKEIDGL